MTINVLIVDDEPLAREGIALRLQQEKDVNIIGECENGRDAIRSILSLKPDLVFLDIKMPKLNGFDVVNAVGSEYMPPVIFLTAYDEYAIEAFTAHAIDYLLKPIDNLRFKESLNHAREQILKNKISQRSEQLTQLLTQTQGLGHTHGPISASEPSSSYSHNERLVIRSNGHVYLLKSEDIYWVEAEGDYISVHTPEKSHLVRETMKNMELRLTDQGFQRVHRSSIVNLNYVRELVSLDNGDYQIILRDDTCVKLSRNYRDILYQKLNAV
ncbi:LytR/AlgR family response regulator transcription factor [Pseudoalteromonas denitrificans]|jgi:two-component system LytT family response regulator|uniref:Two component transcriptional regulator, LytTR family n=1 Tax=Pseudoalteromonas denitrificans DSM 6059 TaxID=1123010 RepID=A0A1I1TEW8_9GAMM|nr:LytTR family DNA-binding domain-containing protein [Pseudoalteromonas denitrificans]SFD57171.1 two component transcriptional regulator, LytTR family [Pseudoalteromonas denitrificans DSM 6059]